MKNRDEPPIVQASTDWSGGLQIHLTFDTSYEPIFDMSLFYSQFVATLQAAGFKDEHIDNMFREQDYLKPCCKVKNGSCPPSNP